MKGSLRKKKKGAPKKTSTKKVTSEVSSSFTKESNALPDCDSAKAGQSSACFLSSTPKRGRRRTRQTQDSYQTTTPLRNSSTDKLSSISSKTPPGTKQAEPEYTEIITRLKTPAIDSQSCKSQNKNKKGHVSKPRQAKKWVTKVQTQTCTKISSPKAKRQAGKKRKTDTGGMQKDTTPKSSKRLRPRFELKKPDAEQQDESLLSSDLSIELSHDEERLPSCSLQEEEESDEEELPSFLLQVDKKSLPITEGAFVWCKFRNYPFWPALVKSVNRKQKKASIIFIDDPMIHQKKGFFVALKTMKPFDCADADQLVCNAKENYGTAIVWSLELISDYRIRIACGSFSGSFIEYIAHGISYPVRRMYPQAASERLTITSDTMIEGLSDDKEDSLSEQQGEISKSSKRLLPDRTHAAHNRANEKLVHFIVKQRMVEGRLLAVIHGKQQSRWLRSFVRAKRRQVVNIYLEDDQQLDQVYSYLNDLYATAMNTAPGPTMVKSLERVPFVLDVLLPEAIIYAIAGVDNVSLKKAEEKYLKGRCISNRERQEFDLMIEREIRKKTQNQKIALHHELEN
ncbi:PWWP domain-containing DNA repair factor 3B-like isoform X2 [Echeneis naucrates]|uniref:PWWP domain-containing DNA repair factor 3B-like isoform X2 n=1 Tax=Echeneis naucrates TaxID=173247 RepID=UPI0011144C45|nr:PWWP domain-containing DNA repair factor 3B-like isoform X2 [Echeneis naucrates]